MKSCEYRGCEYTIENKGAQWHGSVTVPTRDYPWVLQRRTKNGLVNEIHRWIDLCLDYEGDHTLEIITKLIAENIAGYTTDGDSPTVKQMQALADKFNILVKRLFERQYAKNVDAELIAKLRRMTVENGATPGEAANAAAILERMGAA